MKKTIKTALLLALISGSAFAGINKTTFLIEKLIKTPLEQSASKTS